MGVKEKSYICSGRLKIRYTIRTDTAASVKCEIKFRLAGVNSGTPDVTSAQSRFLPCQLFQSAGVQGLAPSMK